MPLSNEIAIFACPGTQVGATWAEKSSQIGPECLHRGDGGSKKYNQGVHKYTTGCYQYRTEIKSHLEILSCARTQPMEYLESHRSVSYRPQNRPNVKSAGVGFTHMC